MNRAAACAPLLALLRTTLAEHGEVTFRTLPAGQVDACHNPRVIPHARVVELPDDQDDVRFLTTVVYGLYALATGGEDPRLTEAAALFVQDATTRTVAAMGVVAR